MSQLEHVYFKFTQGNMQLPDPAIAFMLLPSCRLPGSDSHIVMSAIEEKSYENMKSTLKNCLVMK